MKKPIRILTPTTELLGEISNYESLFFTRSWNGIGDLELRINRYMNYTDTLQKGNIIIIGKDIHKAYQIKHREIELDEDGKITENWLIKALELKSVVGQRITIPPPDTAYDNKSGPSETVIKHYINNNLVNPVDVNRKIEQLYIAPDLERGTNLSYSSRFKNLAEEVEIISSNGSLGWVVYLDILNKLWVFDVKEGRDLSVNQNVNSPVIFSPKFESIKDMKYVQSDLNYKNSAIVAGQGEGVERRVTEVGTFSGLDRHEIFIDARDVEEVDDEDNPIPEEDIIKALTERGEQKLNGLTQEEYLEAQLLTPIVRTRTTNEYSFLSTFQISENQVKETEMLSPFNYEIDYDLGDIVTIQNPDWGITLNTRITEIKEIYEINGFKLEASFGNNRPTLIQKIKQELGQMSGEVRK